VGDWNPIASAPFAKDLELSVIERSEVHALMFPCRRTARGWINSTTQSAVSVAPTHWRLWGTGPHGDEGGNTCT
jgi:hypothetical protein